MGRLGTGIALLFGGFLGAAGSMYYFRSGGSRAEQNRLATENASLQRVLQARSGELDELRLRFKAVQEEASGHKAALDQLRAEYTRSTGWQERMPAFARHGQRLAQVPDVKLTSVSAAVAARALPVMAGDPQDLAEIAGLGATFEQRLYKAGIGTYWEIANLADDELQRLLAGDEEHLPGLDFAAIRADALRLAEATNTVGILWGGVTLDDFEPIHGIGKVFEQRLYDAGIRTYRDLAAATPEELAEVCRAKPPQRPDYASWIHQARMLLSGDA